MTLLDWGILLAGVLLLGVALLVSSLAAQWTLGRFRDWRSERRRRGQVVHRVGEHGYVVGKSTTITYRRWRHPVFDGSSQVGRFGEGCRDCDYVELATMGDPIPEYVLDRPCREHTPPERLMVDAFDRTFHYLAYNAARDRYVKTGDDADLEDMLTHITTEDRP